MESRRQVPLEAGRQRLLAAAHHQDPLGGRGSCSRAAPVWALEVDAAVGARASGPCRHEAPGLANRLTEQTGRMSLTASEDAAVDVESLTALAPAHMWSMAYP
ncbi:uncharacterized protein AAES06_013989 [Glossophaga mutica]